MPYHCPQCLVEYRDGFETCYDCGVPLASGPPPDDPPPSEENGLDPAAVERLNFVEIAHVASDAEAEFLRGVLESNRIPVLIESGLRGALGGATGFTASVRVPAAEADRAALILRK